jgi:hypothetical protein
VKNRSRLDRQLPLVTLGSQAVKLGKILMRVRDEIMAPLCVSSPKDGSVHSCSALDCPVHGERNRTVPGFGPLPEEVEGVRLLKRKEGDPQ